MLRVQVDALKLPHRFLCTLPYLAMIAVRVLAFRGAKQRGYLGKKYDRESRTSS